MTSAEPPAPNGTMIFNGRDGQACANAGRASATAPTPKAAPRISRRVLRIVLSSPDRGLRLITPTVTRSGGDDQAAQPRRPVSPPPAKRRGGARGGGLLKRRPLQCGSIASTRLLALLGA